MYQELFHAPSLALRPLASRTAGLCIYAERDSFQEIDIDID